MNRIARFTPLVLLTTVVLGAAQQSAQPTASGPPAPKHYYRLNYVLKELDDSKVVNQRSFMLTTTADASAAGDWTRLRAGTRLPVMTGAKDVSYIDVGVNLDNRLREIGETLSLEVRAEISSVATDSGGNGSLPNLRQVKGDMDTVIAEGKPAVVFSADDPASRHRFELQVTATREH